jgi:hypothetical protein
VFGNGLHRPEPPRGSGAAAYGSQTPLGLSIWTSLGSPDLPFPQEALPDSAPLLSVWDTQQSPDYTRQRALDSDFVGKDVFAECLLSGTPQRLCRVLALGKM